MNNEDRKNMDFIDLEEFVQMPKQMDTRTASADKIYGENIRALRKHHPELAEKIEKTAVDEEKIRIFDSGSGNPRIVYTREDGEDIKIHSSDDPVECAGKAVELLGSIEKEGIIVLFGFGLGYFAEEIFRRFEKGHLLLIYEAAADIFRQALRVRDFSELFKSDRVKVIVGTDTENLSVLYSHHHLIANGKFWIVNHKPSVKLNMAAYDKFFRKLNEEKRVSDLGVATILGRGKEFINAFLENVPSIIRMPGVNKLKNLFRDRPAIIVSAGPSLDRNMHLLKRAKGKAVIIAADAALPSLLSAGIIPDLAVAVDPVSDNIDDKFRDVPVLKELPFICLAQYTPDLIRMYPGPIFINSVPQNTAFQWLSGFWENNGHIECFGGSVAHLAFAAAEFLGANVISFVGQDLSYSGERVHSSGYSDTLDRILEKRKREGTGNIPGETTEIDIFGDEVRTIRQFLTFRTAFENRIRDFRGKVVNTTEGGLPIEGAVNMRLSDFINEYCDNIEEQDTFAHFSRLSDLNVNCNLGELINELVRARNKFDEIKKTSRQVLRNIKRANRIKERGEKDGPELAGILKKTEKLIEKVKHPVLNLLVGYHYGLELYLKKQEVQEIDDMDDKWEMLEKQLQRGRIYYSEIIKAIHQFNKQISRTISALKRERDIDGLLKNESLPLEERLLKAGITYKKYDMTAQAVKCLEAMLCNNADDNNSSADSDTNISLAELYMKQFRFYEVKSMMETMLAATTRKWTLTPDNEEKVKRILKLCDKKTGEWETKKMQMSGTLEHAEMNYGSYLESGYFYFRIKDYARAESAYANAIDNAGNDRGAAVAAYYGLAHTYISLNDIEKAISCLEKAITIDPENAVLYRDLGLIATQNNNPGPAEIFFTKAIELSPHVPEFYKLLAGLYLSLGEKDKVLKLYEHALSVNPGNPDIQAELAIMLKETIAENVTQ